MKVKTIHCSLIACSLMVCLLSGCGQSKNMIENEDYKTYKDNDDDDVKSNKHKVIEKKTKIPFDTATIK